jgi:hypothetical protein
VHTVIVDGMLDNLKQQFAGSSLRARAWLAKAFPKPWEESERLAMAAKAPDVGKAALKESIGVRLLDKGGLVIRSYLDWLPVLREKLAMFGDIDKVTVHAPKAQPANCIIAFGLDPSWSDSDICELLFDGQATEVRRFTNLEYIAKVTMVSTEAAERLIAAGEVKGLCTLVRVERPKSREEKKEHKKQQRQKQDVSLPVLSSSSRSYASAAAPRASPAAAHAPPQQRPQAEPEVNNAIVAMQKQIAEILAQQQQMLAEIAASRAESQQLLARMTEQARAQQAAQETTAQVAEFLILVTSKATGAKSTQRKTELLSSLRTTLKQRSTAAAAAAAAAAAPPTPSAPAFSFSFDPQPFPLLTSSGSPGYHSSGDEAMSEDTAPTPAASSTSRKQRHATRR